MVARVQLSLPDVTPDQLGIHLIRVADGATGSHQAERFFYPASTVKIFYLGYLFHLGRAGLREITPEVLRAARAMIVDSNNDATAFVVDILTGTAAGAELPPSELATFLKARKEPEDWYLSQGFDGLILRQKTWAEGPYGRERQALGFDFEFRNRASARLLASLMAHLATPKLWPQEDLDAMKEMLERLPARDLDRPLGQIKNFLGRGLPEGWNWYAKAGWAYTNRNDMALCQSPRGNQWAIGVMSEGHLDNEDLLPQIGQVLFDLAD